MTGPLRRAVWTLGAAQCVVWGVVYYGYAALVVPLGQALGLARVELAAAFSLALAVTALAAPLAGRGIDAGHGAALMRAGLLLGAVGLAILALATGGVAVFAAWLVLGVAMALALYEPAFGLIVRAIDDRHVQLRALSAVTVLGGLASTVFLPLLGAGVEHVGWRATLAAAAGALVAAALALERWTFPVLGKAATPAASRGSPRACAPRRRLAAESLLFVTGTLAAMALTVLLVPMLVDRGASPVLATGVLAAVGVSQLPGRVVLLHRLREPHPLAMLAVPLVLQGVGLLIVAAGAPLLAVALGVAVFGAGAGLQTLVRPWLLERRYGAAQAGALNGRVARLQGFARAAGPVLAAGAAAQVDASLVFAALGVMLLALLPVARALARAPPQ